jgi:uncharacterized protein with FMN-binding domain
MLNASGIDMNSARREPSRLPVRGTIATVGTVGAMALLFSFRGGPFAPDESVLAALDTTVATEPQATPTGETSGAAAAVGPMTLTGDAYTTPFGDVQLEVTLDGGDITEVVALSMPADDRQSRRISEYVEPILREEAITADSADISVISGATYTSEAYLASLQSALDGAVSAASTDSGAAASVPGTKADRSTTDGSTAGTSDTATAGGPVTVTGQAVRFRFGSVQVAVTVDGHDITDVQALQLPDGDRHSAQISDYVEPILRDEAIAADSADVSVISGATYTSRAYAMSLQSALDQLA